MNMKSEGLRLAAALAAGLVGGVVWNQISGLLPFVQPTALTAQIITATKELALRDSAGNIVAWLGINSDGNPALNLRWNQGQGHIILGGTVPGSYGLIILKDDLERAGLIFLNDMGSPLFRLADRHEKARVAMGIATRGDLPFIGVFDEKGMLRANMGNAALEDMGTGRVHLLPTCSLSLFDSQGKVIWMAP